MALRMVQFLAIMLTALALVPSGAHLAALPNKMAMAQPAYFVAQQIYAGWAFFGIVLFGALIAKSGARDRAAQAGPIIRLCARLIFAYCCQPRHLLRLDLPRPGPTYDGDALQNTLFRRPELHTVRSQVRSGPRGDQLFESPILRDMSACLRALNSGSATARSM